MVAGEPPGLGPGNPTFQGVSCGASVLQLGAPPPVAPSQTCFFESSVAPAAPGSVGPQSQLRHTHTHTRVCFMVAGAPGEGHSLGTRQEAANGVLPAEG